MASKYKTGKTELIAIYRLEFYKNKKNWKLCQDVKKEPPQVPSLEANSKHLNKTYDVEPELEEEQVSPHNQAFLHEEPADDAPDIEPPPPDPELTELPVSDQLCQQAWEEQPWTGDQAWLGQQEWCGAEAEGVPDDIAYTDQCDGPCRQHMWPSANPYEPPKSTCEQEQLDYLSPADLLHLAEEWLLSHGYPLGQQEYAQYYEQYGLVDDSADFVRGAHAAPHSSEIDLSDTIDECACTRGSLCHLSSRQLSGAVRTHAIALRELLTEHALRGRLSQSCVTPPLSLDDYPTRDTDPLRPPDAVLSGSHLALSGAHAPPDTGRGRGRLRQLIGIGMGRPYRL